MNIATNDVRFVRNREIVSRLVGDEIVIVPFRHSPTNPGFLYGLNSVACVVWECLAKRCTVAEIAQSVCKEFDVTPEEAQDDVREFLESLVKARLVVSQPN